MSAEAIMAEFSRGNAYDDAVNGVLVGPDLGPDTGPYNTPLFTMKVEKYAKGTGHETWATYAPSHTLTTLVSGFLQIELREQNPDGSTEESQIIMFQPGQFASWGPNVEYRWRALADSALHIIHTPDRIR